MDTKQSEVLRLAYTLDLLAMDMEIPRMAATELRRLHAENERLRTCNKDAQHEIANLQERVQQLGQLARDVNSRRVMELEAQLEAIGAGGVEPLRKRECLHQIIEPQPQPAAQAGEQAGEQNHLPMAITSAPERIWLDLGFNPYEDDVHFSHLHDLTWSQNNATGGGVEYVRADLAARGAAQAASEDASARFKAQHEFLIWNREQTPPPIESATEYSVFNQAVDFYIAARAAQEGGA